MKNRFLQKILSLIVLVALTCSCTSIKLRNKKNDKSQSIKEVNCNKIKGINSLQGERLNNQELILTGKYYKADSNKTLLLNLAKDGYTRISFKDEIISDVFFYPEDALQVSIHNSGYLVVMPLSSLPVQLTITTRSRITQDLILKFTNKKPQPITLIKGGKDVK